MKERDLTPKDRAAIWEARKKADRALEAYVRARWESEKDPTPEKKATEFRLDREATAALTKAYALEGRLRNPSVFPVSIHDAAAWKALEKEPMTEKDLANMDCPWPPEPPD